jgi:hypothetical protein
MPERAAPISRQRIGLSCGMSRMPEAVQRPKEGPSAASVSYVDTGVTDGVNHGYRVRAINSAGASAYTNEVFAIPP